MPFRMNQHSDGDDSNSELYVPGCSNNTEEDGSIIYTEIRNGKIKLYVYADINSQEPTHIIDLDGARKERREDA